MNQLVKSLVKPFLTEDQAQGKEVIAVVPGGYKPPTLGHYYLVDQVSKKPEVDKTLVLIGHKERDGITKEDALDIWNIYENHLTGDIDIRISNDVSPIKELFSLIGDNLDKYFVLVVGVRSEEDLKDVRRFDNLKKKFDNLEVVQVKGEDAIRGTNARKAVLGKDFIDFNRYLPVELSDTERDQIWNILTRETETLNEVGEASITPYKWEQEYTDNVTTVVSFETESGLEYNVELERDVYEGIPILEVEFVAGMVDPDTGGTMSSKTITNKGELFRVMSTIVDIIKHYVNKTEAQDVTYSPSKKGDETISTNQRNTLYKAFLKKQVPGVEFKQDSDYVVALFPGYEELDEAKESAKGTGKKPKGSCRRLYTDENPKDTVGIKFSTKQDIIDTLNKASFKSKPHARQSQIINVIHQRVRAAYGRAKDPEVKKRLKTALDYAEQRKEASKKKTERLKKQKNENVAPNHDGKAAPYGSGYKETNETITATKVICDGCGWSWDKKDGGDDLYMCHKCGHDNTPKSDPFDLNELAKDFVKEVFEEVWNPKESFISLSQYMKDNGMNITPLPKIKVINDDKENASNLLGKTAYYDPNEKSITLYTLDRHPKDILRSFAHEMVHHEQNLNGVLGNITTTNTNEDDDLPEIEREAYEKGNMMLRNWEDGIKNV